jgi:hypothetical protein
LPGLEHAANNVAAVMHAEIKKPCLLRHPSIHVSFLAIP